MFDNTKIAELYPEAEGLMIEPMLIKKPKDDNELKAACASGKYFGQVKKDGAFYQFVRTENYSYLFGRTVSKDTNLLTEKGNRVPHIMEQLNKLPHKTILIGEIYYPNKTSKGVVPIMGSLPEKAIQRQQGEYGYIHYYIHDIIMYNGINFITAQTDNYTRYKILTTLFNKYELATDFIELADIYEENLYTQIGYELAQGEEGMVIKAKDGLYQPGKRPACNLKAKKVDYADVIITGFEMPTIGYYGKELETWQYWINPDIILSDSELTINDLNKLKQAVYPIGFYYNKYTEEESGQFYAPVTKPFYMGWWNARIKIGAYGEDGQLLEIGTIHSGISDEMKKDMTEHPENYLNHVCSIQMMEKDSIEHTIRHGFFIQMRTDKNAKDCTISNLF